MSGGKKTTTNSTQNASTQTTLPAWLTGAGQSLYGDAAAAAGRSKVGEAYGGELTAGSDPNQTQAAMVARNSTGAWKPALDGATALTTGAATAGPASVNAAMFTPEAASYYMNPFIRNVQANTLDTMRTQGAADHQALNDSAQASRAFGGNRQAVLEAALLRDQAKARTDYVDSSNAAGYDNAQGQFNADANRSLSADTTNAGLWEQMLSRMMGGGAQLGQLAGEGSDLATRDISNLSTTGATQRDINQASDSARYAEWNRQNTQPLDQYAQLMSILNGTPRDVSTTGSTTGTSTTKQQGSLLDTILAAGQIAASAFSDPKAKKDVRLLERLANGLGVYRFRYLWQRSSEEPCIGVMADEVERIFPAALGPIINGFRTVNYNKLVECLV